MKRFRETGSMLRDPSKGSSLRRDLSEGASSLKSAFKKIKDAGKSLNRGTKDLSATRVMQGPAAGSSLIAASKNLFPKKDSLKFTKPSRTQNQRDAASLRDARDKWKESKPKLSDFSSGRRISDSERKKYNEAVSAWKSNKPM